jgi:DNA-binding NarL/FixJ family response regulator
VTTVLIVDDQPMQRFGYRMLLESAAGTTVLGEAGSGAEAVRQAAALHPDVVLMDIRMPGMDGIEATRRILASGGRSRVLVVTTFDLDEYVYEALRAGASGFLLKDAHPEELLHGIRAVAAGDAVAAPALTRRLLEAFVPASVNTGTGTAAARRQTEALSEREREVLRAMAGGLTNGEIAERFVLSESTVKGHVGRILAKTGCRDRVQAVILAYEAGLARTGRAA